MRETSNAPRVFLCRVSAANDSRCPAAASAVDVDGKLPVVDPMAPVIVEKSNPAIVERVRGNADDAAFPKSLR